MKRRVILAVMAIVLSFNLFSQVRDVAFTVSPYAEHVWWNKNTTLNNSTFWGARAGFSFGPLFELRGFYQKSFDVEASLRKVDWSVTDDWADKMTQSYIDMSRYGGEIKMNLMNSRVFAPYITLGGGVQQFSFEVQPEELVLEPYNLKEEQLFAAVGLGTKFNLSRRVVLSLEAKHMIFNANDKSYYMCVDCDMEEGQTKRLGNWSAVASLDFYLGGSKAGKSEVHNAYRKMFSDGFAGMKFVVEPGLAYVKLKDDALFEEQYFVGGSAGIDFSSLVGIRGFYYKATEEPGKLALKFNNKMEMYGGNLIARLNQPRGINPYLQLGGGYIKTSNKYINHLGEVGDQSRPFAMGGVGLEIPLSKYVALYGSVNAMLTNEGDKDLSAIENPKQVKTDWMYESGVRFNFGRSVDGDAYYSRGVDRAVMSERDYNNEQINLMRMEYEQRIDNLNEEIELAVMDKDFNRVSQIEDKKRSVTEEFKEKSESRRPYIQLTEEELNNLVKQAVREVRSEAVAPDMSKPQVQPVPVVPVTRAAESTKSVEEQSDAEKKTTEQESTELESETQDEARIVSEPAVVNDNKMDRQFEALNRVIETQSEEIAALKESLNAESARQAEAIAAIESQPQVVETITEVSAKSDPLMKLRGVSALGAMDFGSKLYWNLGLRGHWQIKESNFEFVPEVFMAFGSKKDGFGVSANVLYKFGNKDSTFRPYVGLGVGGFPGNKTVWGTNVIGGVSFDLMLGSLFADYSVRNIFKQNQLSVGYRISF